MAYVDTDTCSYCHGGAYPDTDCDCANTDAGAHRYGSTDAHAHRAAINAYTSADCYSIAYADAYSCANSNGGPVNADTNAHSYTYSNAHTDAECGVPHEMGY